MSKRFLAGCVCLLTLSVVAGSLDADEWIVSKEGVRLHNGNPVPNETCSWTGGKDGNGLAHAQPTCGKRKVKPLTMSAPLYAYGVA